MTAPIEAAAPRSASAHRAGIRRALRRALPVLASADVVLREPVASDARSLARHLGAADVQRYLPPGPSTEAEFRRFIRWAVRERKGGRHLTFALVVPAGSRFADRSAPPGRAVGLFQLWPLDPAFETVELGFALGRAFWGTGLFQEAARLLVDFAVERLGVGRLEARAAADNARGNAALRRLGAVPEGVLRRCFTCRAGRLDHVLWSILAEEWPARRAAADSRQTHLQVAFARR
ncbi:MAG TPA: GNAT family protein [Vicinamibacterales bacterium]|nr:GNAT family protein [Vicinamibacterales bacterium]